MKTNTLVPCIQFTFYQYLACVCVFYYSCYLLSYTFYSSNNLLPLLLALLYTWEQRHRMQSQKIGKKTGWYSFLYTLLFFSHPLSSHPPFSASLSPTPSSLHASLSSWILWELASGGSILKDLGSVAISSFRQRFPFSTLRQQLLKGNKQKIMVTKNN